jgi:hypothetical protein
MSTEALRGRAAPRALSVLLVVLLCAFAPGGMAEDRPGDENWVEVGADTEAKYYVNTRSIVVEGDTIRLQKKAIYTNPLVDNFTGRQVQFKQSLGVVELDCGRHINRVISIEMIGVNGEVVWSSGKMAKRTWEDVRDNTHGGATFDYVCRNLSKS